MISINDDNIITVITELYCYTNGNILSSNFE